MHFVPFSISSMPSCPKKHDFYPLRQCWQCFFVGDRTKYNPCTCGYISGSVDRYVTHRLVGVGVVVRLPSQQVFPEFSMRVATHIIFHPTQILRDSRIQFSVHLCAVHTFRSQQIVAICVSLSLLAIGWVQRTHTLPFINKRERERFCVM